MASYLPTYLPIYPPAHLPTYLPTYPLTSLPPYLPTYSWHDSPKLMIISSMSINQFQKFIQLHTFSWYIVLFIISYFLTEEIIQLLCSYLGGEGGWDPSKCKCKQKTFLINYLVHKLLAIVTKVFVSFIKIPILH